MPRKPAFISHSREREAEVQSRMLDVLEARFKRRISAAIDDEASEITGGYRELGYVSPPSDEAFRRFRDVYMDLAVASARTFGRRMTTQAKALGLDLEVKESSFSGFFRQLALSWVNQEPIRRRIQSVTETTREQIVRQVSRGQREGLGVEQIARLIMEGQPQTSRQRAAVIARTETHGAANFAMNETAKQTGLELEKEWVAVEDIRTRRIGTGDKFDHAAMDGQKRPMDEPFDMPWIGGAGGPLKIMYPGQAGLPSGAVINCRCSAVHSVIGLDE